MVQALWQKQVELTRLQGQVNRLSIEIQNIKFNMARNKLTRLTPNPRAVLRALADELEISGYADMLCYSRKTLCLTAGLDNRQLGHALGILKRLGFIEFVRGLMDEDNRVCGSGYGITKDGLEWWTTVEEPSHGPE